MHIHQASPCLRVNGAAAVIDFYTRAFGAAERLRLSEPSGRIGHAELVIGPLVLMLSEAFPEYCLLAPDGQHTQGASIHLHEDDADAWAARAMAAGAVLDGAISDQFYGERGGRLRDPFGHSWLLGHQIEDVSPAEMQRRDTAMFSAPS